MAHLTPAAHQYFATHHGVASIEQLRQCGLTHAAIRRIVSEGGLELVLQGAYRTPSVPLDELSRCAAVCAAHPELVISGPTAGRVWGLRRLPPDRRIHVIAPPRSQPTRCPWVVPYRTSAIHDRDVVTRADGIRVTSRPRTAFDLSRQLDGLDLRSVIEQVMHDGAHPVEEMRDVAVDWLSPRRRWARHYLEALEGRLGGGPAESHPEVLLAEALVCAGVDGLERQYGIDLPGYGRARFDLAVPRLRWAIEIDVHPSHRESAGHESDQRRDTAAARVGWLVSRVPASGFGDALRATAADLHATYLLRCSVLSGER